MGVPVDLASYCAAVLTRVRFQLLEFGLVDIRGYDFGAFFCKSLRTRSTNTFFVFQGESALAQANHWSFFFWLIFIGVIKWVESQTIQPHYLSIHQNNVACMLVI